MRMKRKGEVMLDSLGDRMKQYEGMECGKRLMPLLPAFARLDGKCFHTFTRNMERPYDQRLSDLMVHVTKYLVEETNACCGYTQSDEITLAWYSGNFKSQIYFDGRISKMTSILAAMCSLYFYQSLSDFFNSYSGDYPLGIPLFDCRVWNVPTLEEGANVFLWREQDATKNSISMAAQSYYSSNQLQNKSGSEMQEMLFQKDVNWNDYPTFFKRGSYVQRKKVLRKFATDEIEKLPLMHDAHRNQDLMVERSDVSVIEMAPLGAVINRIEVIFFGEKPKTT